MRIHLLLAITMLLPLADASASETKACAPVDFSARFGGPRAQEDTDWCGTMVAADLISYRLGFRVSAISVGAAYYAKRSPAQARMLDQLLGIPAAEYGGGLMSSILKIALRSKVCPESALPDDRLGLAKWDVFDSIRALREGRGKGPTCADPYDLSWLKWRVIGHDLWPRPDMDVLHRQIGRRNPVAATVEMNELFELGDEVSAGARWFGNHYVIVVGRRPVPGGCEVLIRNSWGQGARWIAESRFRRSLKNIFYLD